MEESNILIAYSHSVCDARIENDKDKGPTILVSQTSYFAVSSDTPDDVLEQLNNSYDDSSQMFSVLFGSDKYLNYWDCSKNGIRYEINTEYPIVLNRKNVYLRDNDSRILEHHKCIPTLSNLIRDVIIKHICMYYTDNDVKAIKNEIDTSLKIWGFEDSDVICKYDAHKFQEWGSERSYATKKIFSVYFTALQMLQIFNSDNFKVCAVYNTNVSDIYWDALGLGVGEVY